MDSPSAPPCSIPVVDFGGITGGKEDADEEEWQRVAKELRDALTGVGFVYLSNHGISDEQINNFISNMASFFSLPDKTKTSYAVGGQLDHRGYVSMGRESLENNKNLIEFRESYDIMMKNSVFPDAEVPQLRSSALAFLDSGTVLAHRTLTALAIGLGLERDFFTSKHRYIIEGSDGNSSVLRVNHYPPFSADVPENGIRCGAHTDYGCITLLFQDSIGGLQVRDVSGQWVDARPIPGTVLVNAGDLLQMWTANRVKATEHRVVIPKEEARLRASRFSIAFFVHPDDETLVVPTDGSTSPPPINSRQHLLNKYAKTYSY